MAPWAPVRLDIFDATHLANAREPPDLFKRPTKPPRRTTTMTTRILNSASPRLLAMISMVLVKAPTGSYPERTSPPEKTPRNRDKSISFVVIASVIAMIGGNIANQPKLCSIINPPSSVKTKIAEANF